MGGGDPLGTILPLSASHLLSGISEVAILDRSKAFAQSIIAGSKLAIVQSAQANATNVRAASSSEA